MMVAAARVMVTRAAAKGEMVTVAAVRAAAEAKARVVTVVEREIIRAEVQRVVVQQAARRVVTVVVEQEATWAEV